MEAKVLEKMCVCKFEKDKRGEWAGVQWVRAGGAGNEVN